MDTIANHFQAGNALDCRVLAIVHIVSKCFRGNAPEP